MPEQARPPRIGPLAAAALFCGLPFVLLVISFWGPPVDLSGCDNTAERVTFLVFTGLLLAGLWLAGARGRLALAAMAAVACVAVAAVAVKDIAGALVDPVVFSVIAGIYLTPVVVILVLARRVSVERAVLVLGWGAVLLAIPGTFVFLDAACNGLD